MGTLGGALKRKEKLSARLGDILSMLYLCSATLKRYETEGRQEADAPLLHWAIWDAMFKAQNAFEGVISNFPNRFIARLMHGIVFPLGRPYVVPSDRLGHEVARLLIEPSAARDRLTAGMYAGDADEEGVARLDRALEVAVAAEAIEQKLRAAARAGALDTHAAPGADPATVAERAVAAGVITREEAATLALHRELVAQVVRVDDFDADLGASLMQPPQPVTSHSAAVMQAPPRKVAA
jgi:acyl-CoA dehydrogenase